MIKLRPHHLLCIQKFTGHGYSPDFTAHMTALVQAMRSAPSQTVTLVRGTDILCTHCPHNRDSVCDSAEKVAAMDEAVRTVIGCSSGRWDVLAEKARTDILLTKRFHEICGKCQWFALCRKTEVSK